MTDFTVYADVSFAPAGKHSQSGYTTHLSFGGNTHHLIHWQSIMRETKIFESSAEAEFYTHWKLQESARNPHRNPYERKKIPGSRIFSLLDCESEVKDVLALGFIYFHNCGLFCGMCVSHMMITKAKVKNLQNVFAFTKAKAKQNLLIFTCSHFHADDGSSLNDTYTYPLFSD